MPLYFFDTDDGKRHVKDDTGTILRTIDDAEIEALSLLRDLAHTDVPLGRRMLTAIVRDSQDATIYRCVMTVTGRRYG